MHKLHASYAEPTLVSIGPLDYLWLIGERRDRLAVAWSAEKEAGPR